MALGVFQARYEATEQQARMQVAAAARSAGDKTPSSAQSAGVAAAAATTTTTAAAAAEEERVTAAALEEVHRPLLAVRGMARVWGLTKLSTWLEGGGKADLMGRTRMVAVMRALDQLTHADGAWGEQQPTTPAAHWVPTEEHPNPPDAPFRKLSTCEGPSRQRLRAVRDGCGTRHLSAARPVVAREDENDGAAALEQADREHGMHRTDEQADDDAMGTGMFSAPAPLHQQTCRVSISVIGSDVVKVHLKVEATVLENGDHVEDTWHGGVLSSAMSIGSMLEVAAAADSPHRSLFSTPTQLPSADYTDGGLMTHRGEAPARGNDGVPAGAGVSAEDAGGRRRRRGGEGRSYRGDHMISAAPPLPPSEVTVEEEGEEGESLLASGHCVVEGDGDELCAVDLSVDDPLQHAVDLSDKLSAQLQQSGVVRGDLPLMGVVAEEEEEEEEEEEDREGAASTGGEQAAAGSGAGADDGKRDGALEEASRTEEGTTASVAGEAQTLQTPQRGSRTGGSSGQGGTGSVRQKLAGLVAGMTPTAQRVVSSARVTAAQVVRDVGAAVQVCHPCRMLHYPVASLPQARPITRMPTHGLLA
jgi:hypothetical protein